MEYDRAQPSPGYGITGCGGEQRQQAGGRWGGKAPQPPQRRAAPADRTGSFYRCVAHHTCTTMSMDVPSTAGESSTGSSFSVAPEIIAVFESQEGSSESRERSLPLVRELLCNQSTLDNGAMLRLLVMISRADAGRARVATPRARHSFSLPFGRLVVSS